MSPLGGEASPPLSLYEVNSTGRRAWRYAWDNSTKRLIKTPCDDGDSSSSDVLDLDESAGNSVTNWGKSASHSYNKFLLSFRKRMLLNAQCTFLPAEDAVTSDYWSYARWRFVQRISSSCMQVLSTQAMLHAVGVGGGRVGGALPAAAALSWVLKDGLGKMGKLVVNASFANDYDAYAKRSRFLSSVGYTLAIGAEMATPRVPPSLFLLVAACANVFKSVGTTVANTVRLPIQKSFATRENTGEIAARTGTQQVVADNLGLLLAIVISTTLMREPTKAASKVAGPAIANNIGKWAKSAVNAPAKNARRLLYAYPPLAFMDMGCIWLELKSVHMRTLNPERLSILAEDYVRQVPPDPRRGTTARRSSRAEALLPGEVSQRESLWGPLRLSKPADPIPLEVVPLGALVTSREELDDVLSQQAKGRSCYLVYRPRVRRSKQKRRGEAALAIAKGAPTKDIVQSMLQVAYLRALPYQRGLSESQARAWAIGTAQKCAERESSKFLESMRERGWDVSGVLLPSTTYFSVKPPVIKP